MKTDDVNFMTMENVIKAMKEMKLKNSDGGGRIPQRILLDGAELLVKPMSILFKKDNSRLRIG